MTFPKVTIPDSEVRQLESSITGRCYDIYVHLPPGYMQDLEKKYPVLYVLDGQWDFKLIVSIGVSLVFDEFMPETIIVGITYAGADADYSRLRALDYTPVKDLFFPGSGEGARDDTADGSSLVPQPDGRPSYRLRRRHVCHDHRPARQS